MRKDYPKGTTVRLLYNGLEGIIMDAKEGVNFFQYIIEMSYGETVTCNYVDVAPIDHPIQALLDHWNKEGVERGFSGIHIAKDQEGKLHAFYGKEPIKDYNNLKRKYPDYKFLYGWKLRGT